MGTTPHSDQQFPGISGALDISCITINLYTHIRASLVQQTAYTIYGFYFLSHTGYVLRRSTGDIAFKIAFSKEDRSKKHKDYLDECKLN